MIIEGLKLMVLGMVIVYVFLIVLMILVNISAKVFKGSTLTGLSTVSSAKKAEDELIAVLSAAITAYRKRTKK